MLYPMSASRESSSRTKTLVEGVSMLQSQTTIHVIMIPNHEVVISFGGKQRGNLNYVTIIQNSVKILLCKYVIVIVITHKPGPKQPEYAYKIQTKCVP